MILAASSALGVAIVAVIVFVGLSQWRLAKPLALNAPVYGVACLAFAPRGNVLAIGAGESLSVHIMSATDGALLRTLSAAGRGNVASVSFDRSGQALAAGDSNGMLHLWSVPECRELALFGKLRNGIPVMSVCFSPDERYLASVSIEGGSIWRIEDGHETRLQCHGIVTGSSVTFLVDGHLALANADNWMAVYDMQGQEVASVRSKPLQFCSAREAFVEISDTDLLIRSVKNGMRLGDVPITVTPSHVEESFDHALVALGGSDVEVRREADGKCVRLLENPSGRRDVECGAIAFGPSSPECALAVAWGADVYIWRVGVWPYR